MSKQKTCSFCGAQFNCWADDASQKCWCTELPNAITGTGSTDCLCPECLKAKIEKLEAYDAVASTYAQKYGDEILLKPIVQKFIADFVRPIPQNEIICDMGCGPGQVARYLYNNLNRSHTIGIDLSPKMIDEAHKLNPGITFKCADMLQMEEHEVYGGIIALYFIVNFQPEHLPMVFAKLYSLLKNNGRLLLSFHMGNDEMLRVEDMWNSGKAISFYMFTPETVSKALVLAGFKVSEIRYRHPDKEIEYDSERSYIFAVK
jgi:SAM-dependent methyltransferase